VSHSFLFVVLLLLFDSALQMSLKFVALLLALFACVAVFAEVAPGQFPVRVDRRKRRCRESRGDGP
jgi:hypothetical protein